MSITKSEVLTDIYDMRIELESIYDDIADSGLTDSNREELENQSGVIGTILGEWERAEKDSPWELAKDSINDQGVFTGDQITCLCDMIDRLKEAVND